MTDQCVLFSGNILFYQYVSNGYIKTLKSYTLVNKNHINNVSKFLNFIIIFMTIFSDVAMATKVDWPYIYGIMPVNVRNLGLYSVWRNISAQEISGGAVKVLRPHFSLIL